MHNTRTGHMYSVIYLPQYSPRVFSTNLLKCTLNYFDILRKGQRWDMLGLEVAKKIYVCKQCGFQGGINCEASPPGWLHYESCPLKFSNSSKPGWQAGTINATLVASTSFHKEVWDEMFVFPAQGCPLFHANSDKGAPSWCTGAHTTFIIIWSTR